MKFNRLFFAVMIVIFSACEDSRYTEDFLLEEVETKDVAMASFAVNKDSLILNVNTGISTYDGEIFTGTAIIYSQDINVGFQEYKNGRRDGTRELKFLNGTKSYEANYHKGRLNGESTSWWSNGNLRSITNHKQRVLDGNQKQFYKSGVLFKDRNIVAGKEEGMQKSWRENGKLYNNYEAKNGRIFGLKRSSLCFKLEDETVQYKK